jgi:hypothetical protein
MLLQFFHHRLPDLLGLAHFEVEGIHLPHTEELLALRLSDTQLDGLMRLCQPLAPHCRDALLRILAHELRGRHDVGDGELHRIARTIIKDNHLFDPSDLDGRMPRVSKWER